MGSELRSLVSSLYLLETFTFRTDSKGPGFRSITINYEYKLQN